MPCVNQKYKPCTSTIPSQTSNQNSSRTGPLCGGFCPRAPLTSVRSSALFPSSSSTWSDAVTRMRNWETSRGFSAAETSCYACLMIICIISSVTAWNPQPAVGCNRPGTHPRGQKVLAGPTAEVCKDIWVFIHSFKLSPSNI